jgi:hypothetical protein
MSEILTREVAERKLCLVPDLDMEHPFVVEVLDDIAALHVRMSALEGLLEDQKSLLNAIGALLRIAKRQRFSVYSARLINKTKAVKRKGRKKP